ncbi:hypothetical protein L195_g046381, partial [Trifolium pratense]
RLSIWRIDNKYVACKFQGINAEWSVQHMYKIYRSLSHSNIVGVLDWAKSWPNYAPARNMGHNPVRGGLPDHVST